MEKIYTEENIAEVAAWLWQQLQGRKVVALHGQMGAGKTTLVHALCNFLEVKDNVSSPTFAIINEYRFDYLRQPAGIYHIDLYRLRNEEEAVRAGVEDCLYSGNFCFVEWPEKAAALLPNDTVHATISLLPGGARKITIAKK